MAGNPGENHSGELHRETAEQKANRIIAQERTRLGGPARNRELRQGLALDLDNARPT